MLQEIIEQEIFECYEKKYIDVHIQNDAAYCEQAEEPLPQEKPGEDEPEPDPDPEPETGPDQKLTFVFVGTSVDIPLITGPDFKEGTIFWGDGMEEPYSENVSHDYPGNGTFEVVVETQDAEEIHFDNIAGVTSIDFSEF